MADEADLNAPQLLGQRQPRKTIAISKGAAWTGVGTVATLIGILIQSGVFATAERVESVEKNQVRIESTLTKAIADSETRIIKHIDEKVGSLEKSFNKYETQQSRIDERQDRWLEELRFMADIKPKKSTVNR